MQLYAHNLHACSRFYCEYCWQWRLSLPLVSSALISHVKAVLSGEGSSTINKCGFRQQWVRLFHQVRPEKCHSTTGETSRTKLDKRIRPIILPSLDGKIVEYPESGFLMLISPTSPIDTSRGDRPRRSAGCRQSIWPAVIFGPVFNEPESANQGVWRMSNDIEKLELDNLVRTIVVRLSVVVDHSKNCI